MNKFKDNVQTDPHNSYRKSSRNVKNDKVLNKAPSDRQITAEQVIREAYEHRIDDVKQRVYKISNAEELSSYQLRKRIDFEENLRRQPHSINCWLRYAKFEETQSEWERVRSIFERALHVDYRNRGIWLKYAEFEAKNKFPNHARNVWDRAVQLLPRTDQFWYKYGLMEEKLGNFDKARAVFERWMKWNPPATAWESYIKLEMRCGGKRYAKVKRARKVWERFAAQQMTVEAYLKWAKFEEKFGEVEDVRAVYTAALNHLCEEAYEVKFFASFAAFEAKAKEAARARQIYRFALDHVPRSNTEKLLKAYAAFEKQSGARGAIDDLAQRRKRLALEKKLTETPLDYEAWFDLIRLEECAASEDPSRSIGLFERAVAALPLAAEKRLWRRYIFLWLRYAAFCELRGDGDRAVAVLQRCVELVPHERFTFAKLWLQLARLHVRRLDLPSARRVLGEALGRCPKPRLFRGYIELETRLLSVDRVRRLYEKFLAHAPENCEAWAEYAAMEAALGEEKRCRAIFELGVGQEALDMPERLWMRYIDFEAERGEEARVEALFERLLQRSGHAKVWLSFAETMERIKRPGKARRVFERAEAHFREKGAAAGPQRAEVLRVWVRMEQRLGERKLAEALRRRLPTEVKRRRPAEAEGGALGGFVDSVEFVFPGDGEERKAHEELLSMAHQWKKAKMH